MKEKLTKELYVAETIFSHTMQGQIESNEKEIACLHVSVENINAQLKAFLDRELVLLKTKKRTFLS